MSELKRIRQAAGLSQSKLADLSQVSVRLIQDYEQGHKSINRAASETVYKLSRALGRQMEDLIEK